MGVPTYGAIILDETLDNVRKRSCCHWLLYDNALCKDFPLYFCPIYASGYHAIKWLFLQVFVPEFCTEFCVFCGLCTDEETKVVELILYWLSAGIASSRLLGKVRMGLSKRESEWGWGPPWLCSAWGESHKEMRESLKLQPHRISPFLVICIKCSRFCYMSSIYVEFQTRISPRIANFTNWIHLLVCVLFFFIFMCKGVGRDRIWHPRSYLQRHLYWAENHRPVGSTVHNTWRPKGYQVQSQNKKGD